MKHRVRRAVVTAMMAAAMLLCLVACNASQTEVEQTQSSNTDLSAALPWENGGKAPSEYTWEEFLALDGSTQEAFVESFKSPAAFERWEKAACPKETTTTASTTASVPWENGEKQPSEYTWAEFEALSGAQQEQFVESFASAEEFARWEQSVHPTE